jgi:hypothetical protein
MVALFLQRDASFLVPLRKYFFLKGRAVIKKVTKKLLLCFAISLVLAFASAVPAYAAVKGHTKARITPISTHKVYLKYDSYKDSKTGVKKVRSYSGANDTCTPKAGYKLIASSAKPTVKMIDGGRTYAVTSTKTLQKTSGNIKATATVYLEFYYVA